MSIKYANISQGTSLEPGLIQVASNAEVLEGTNTAKAVTPAALEARIAALVDGAPGTLDTLKEIADAINNDPTLYNTLNVDITALETRIYNLENGLTAPPGSASQGELDDTQTGAGLNTDGSYTAPTSSNYLSSATSLKDADSKLDTQIAANTAAISSLGSGNIASLQSEIDDTQASVGLQTDGTLGTWANNNYYSASASIKGAVEGVDAQVATNTAAIAGLGSSAAITALQGELDDTQSGVGLASDGSHVARTATNYINSATSVVGEITLLDGQIKTNADAIALKADASSLSSYALDSDLTSAVADIATNASNISTNTTNIALKASQADLNTLSSTVSGHTTDIAANASAISSNDTDIADHETRITSLESGSSTTALQTELDATQVGAGLASDGSYSAITGANYATSTTSLKAAITQLDTQLKSTQDDLDTAETSLALKADSSTVSAISTEVTATQSSSGLNADGSFTANSGGNYIQSATTIRGEINALDTQVATNAGDISNLSSTVSSLTSGSSSNASDIASLQSEVDATQAGAGLGATGAYGANSGSNYITAATSLKDADNKLDAQIKTNANAIALKAASSTVTSLASDVATNTSNISTLNTTVSGHTTDIAANLSAIQSNDSDISSLQSSKADATTVSGIDTELTATQSAVGLNTNGTYSAHTGSNYINAATSVKGAMTLLDTQIKANANDITSNTTSIGTNSSDITSLETLADTHETALGLNTNGTYTAIASANYASSTNLKGAVAQLDTQAKTNADNIATEISNRQSADSTINSTISTLQSEVDTTQTGAGLGTNGAYTANTGSNYLTTATSLKDADDKLDAQIKTNANSIATNASDISTLQSDVSSLATSSSISALQSEVNDIETSVGLNSDGSYTALTGNYNTATTIKGAISGIDTQVKTNADNISSNDTDISNLQTLANTHESSIGLNADGSYTAIVGNYAVSSTSLKAAVGQLDTQVKTNADAIALRATTSQLSTLQSEVDAIESSAGFATNGSYVQHSGSNYIDSGASLKAVDLLLDAAIKTRQDNIDTEASTRASADTTLTNAINTVEASVGLQADGSLSITGTNYLNTSSTVVAALGTLDTNQKYLRDVQDNLRGTVGSGSTGLLGTWGSSNYVGSDTSLKSAIESLDTQVASNASSISSNNSSLSSSISGLQTELDDTQTGVGLASNGDYVSRSGTNYLDSATNVVGEITALDTQVKTNADNIALKANSTTLSALDTRVTQLETGGGGILLDHSSDDAVEMDATISEFSSHSGPFQINLAGLITGGVTDLIFYGGKGERDGDRHFAIDSSNGDAVFAGKYS